ncbi:Protein phosphatase 2C-like protein [Smittium mucronatum]|uniref:Protein phosphatase 2C-like protein n=1 Tax=Smittium mucronatum TaxID=133383 RepID=A0A1R0GTF2_9FUNG|nr:Protein phosphatase 2C-like protein [Smittium mucronatum]
MNENQIPVEARSGDESSKKEICCTNLNTGFSTMKISSEISSTMQTDEAGSFIDRDPPFQLSAGSIVELKENCSNPNSIKKSTDSSLSSNKRVAIQRSTIPPPINVNDAKLNAQKSLTQKLLFMSPSPSPPIIPEKFSNPDSELAKKEKDSESSKTSSVFSISVSSDRNRRYRRTMEDAHHFEQDFCGVHGQLFAAVFDGHSGKKAAEWCGKNFHKVFQKLLEQNPDSPVERVLNDTFVEVDYTLANTDIGRSGCTAVVVFIRPSISQDQMYDMYVANVGDARCIYIDGLDATRLTYDHKGSDQNEANRIISAGGYVFDDRVNGVLAVTRSLGDVSMKQFVIGNPYISHSIIHQDSGSVIIACDGLWDVCSDQKAAEIIGQSPDTQTASNSLLEYALDNLSTDNISVMVIYFA